MKTTSILFALMLGVLITLEWDANLEPDLAGYRFYKGLASRTYEAPVGVDVADNPTHTVNVPLGTHFFAVTAVNENGLESGYSNEVSGFICIDAVGLQRVANDILVGTGDLDNDVNADGNIDALDIQRAVNAILAIDPCPVS
jgi:hypothetical protein